jgi:hypothetical protein
MRFKDRSVTATRVGIVGLHDALKTTGDLDPEDRTAIVDGLIALVTGVMTSRGRVPPSRPTGDGRFDDGRVAARGRGGVR